MKSKTRMLCTLMALILVFSLTGVSAFADMLVVPGGAVLSVAVTAERDDVTPGSYTNDAGEEVLLNPEGRRFSFPGCCPRAACRRLCNFSVSCRASF